MSVEGAFGRIMTWYQPQDPVRPCVGVGPRNSIGAVYRCCPENILHFQGPVFANAGTNASRSGNEWVRRVEQYILERFRGAA
jgi:hypothetical protein